MPKTLYCDHCLNSFKSDAPACPNLACGRDRPPTGWGRLLEKGDLLDRRYRVRNRLAVGGAGITYWARELDDDNAEIGPELAIKVLFQRGGETMLRRLANEARVLQELRHPHIVESRGFVQRAGHPAYLVTVYEPGGNLFDHVRHHGALTVEASLGILRDVLSALAVAHRRGVIHRDLKPQNIFLRTSAQRDQVPHVLVADFGIAKLQGFMGEHLTTAGTFVGTPEFAAPEQFKGLEPLPASDLFAAGCVFWFCLTGAPPIRFVDRTDLVTCLRALREGLPPSLHPASCPEPLRAELQDVLNRLFAIKPEDRLTHVELAAAVDRWVTPASAPLPSPTMGTLTPESFFGLEVDTPTLDPVPSAPVRPAPPAPAPAQVGPPPAPVAPPASPEPAGRLRLGAQAPVRHVQPARPRELDDGFEAMFESQTPPTVPHTPSMSLDDLFDPPSPPVAATRPAAAPIQVDDARWETVQDESEPPPPAVPDVPPPTVPLAPAWSPADPQTPESPSDDPARVRALGRCAVGDRDALFAALENPETAARPSDESVVALCGAHLVVAHFALKSRANAARNNLTHAEADVRATAALAVGAVGGMGQLALLSRMLTDPEATVRLAAIHGLRDLGERTGRLELVREWVAACANDPDPRVEQAARA